MNFLNHFSTFNSATTFIHLSLFEALEVLKTDHLFSMSICMDAATKNSLFKKKLFDRNKKVMLLNMFWNTVVSLFFRGK